MLLSSKHESRNDTQGPRWDRLASDMREATTGMVQASTQDGSLPTVTSLRLADQAALRFRVAVPRRPAVVAALSLVLLVAGLALGLTREHSARMIGRSGKISQAHATKSLNDTSLARIRRKAAARQHWLENPRERAQREMSQMAFHHLSAQEARGVVERVYGTQLAAMSANPAASVAASGRVVRYIGDNRALVRTTAGLLEHEISSMPLRVAHGTDGKQLVSLVLRKSGDAFVPVNPLHNVAISGHLDGGVAIGSSAIRLIPQGTDTRAQLVGASTIFYPQTGPDEDTAVAPTAGGVELSTVLRSRLSPQQINYRVIMPAGAVLRSSSAGAVISDGTRVVRVLTPTARDAQGQSLPVQMTVSDHQLILHVAHRRKDVAYPLLVDPSVTEEHCCGEWQFKGSEWGEKNEKSEGGFLSDETGVLEAETGTYETQQPTKVAQIWKNEWAEEHGWLNTKMTFYGVEFTTSGDRDGIIYGSIGGLCQAGKKSQSYTWNSSENGLPPSTLTFPSREEYAKDSFHWCTPDGFAMAMGTPSEISEPYPEGCGHFSCTTTAPVRLAIGSVLIVSRSEKSLVHHRRRGVRHREVLGPSNPGEPNQLRVCEGKPVECATGNETETQTDLNVPGRGVPLSLVRTYNSQAAVMQATPGPFGYGWSASFGDHLNINEGAKTVSVEQANGSAVVFTGNPRTAGELTPPPWAQAKLVVESGGAFLYTLPNQQTLHFEKSGALNSEADRNGNMTTVKYSGTHIESVTDPSGRKLTFKYNGSGEVESVKDPMGRTVKYTYESGNLASIIEPGETSPRWQFKYDSSHELTEMIDGRSGKTTNEYNSSHQVVSQTDPASRTLHFEYEELPSEAGGEYQLPELSQETAEEETQEEASTEELSDGVVKPAPETVSKVTNQGTGAVTFEHYNNEDELQTLTKGYGTSGASTEKYTFNSPGAIVSITDGDEHVTKYGYDSEGNLIEQVDPDGDVTKWEYDTSHDITSTTTPDGETTTIKRETHGNPESISRPAPGEKTQTTKYKYTSYGQLESVTDPLERTWKYEYDPNGDRKSETNPEGNKRTWEYNEDSQEIATISPRGNVSGGKPTEFTTKVERDTQGRPLTITDPLKHTTKYKYDGDGDIETMTDGNSHTTTYTYNGDNQPIKVKEANGDVTETEYDPAGQIVAQIDGNKHKTKYVRNALEQVAEITNPRERKTTKEYDGADNLKTLTDAEKRTTTYTYDPANRLKEVSYSDGKTHATEYEYSKDGEVTSMKDGSGTTKYIYDRLDRLTEVENGHKEVTKYEYDLASELTKITYPNGKVVTRTYDKDGRLERVTDWFEHATKFSYDPDSDLTSTTFPTETKDEDKYAYNDADQMSEVKMLKNTETLASLLYTRDSDGQVKTITSKGLPGEEKPAYEYDTNNRLTKGAGIAYEYDAANNPTKLGAGTYKYTGADELESGTGFTYTYNEVGERAKTTPTTGPATTYGYDEAGELITAERPKEGSTAEIKDSYAYNGEGLRVSQTISGTTGYMAWDTAEELPLLLADGTNSYIYGPGNLPIEQINSEGHAIYLHHDQSGSTRLITGSAGTGEGTFTYDGYGNQTGHSGTVTTPLGYDGQYTNSDTGFISLPARSYDPATGQFISGDPALEQTREPYSYAGDDPLNLFDPSGLFLVGVGVGGGGAFGPIVGTGSASGWLNPTHGNAGVTGTGGIGLGGSTGEIGVGPVLGVSNASKAQQLTGPFTQACGAGALILGIQFCFEAGHDECGDFIWSAQAGPILGWGAAGGIGKSETVTPEPVDQDPVFYP